MIQAFALAVAVVHGAAILSPRSDAEPPVRATVCETLIVDLRDGSRLFGRLPSAILQVETSTGALQEVPLVRVKSLEMEDDRESAVLELRDGSRLQGVVRPDPLRLGTAIGELNVALAKVASCRVELAVTAEGNVALAARGAKVRGVFDGRSGPALIDGNAIEYGSVSGSAQGGSHGSAHVVGLRPSWVVELPQTYLLSEIRVLLWDRDQRFYRYMVETSLDGKVYQTAADRSQGEWRSWQKLAFSPRAARYIRLRGLYSSRLKSPNGLHVIELEAYCHPPRRE